MHQEEGGKKVRGQRSVNTIDAVCACVCATYLEKGQLEFPCH